MTPGSGSRSVCIDLPRDKGDRCSRLGRIGIHCCSAFLSGTVAIPLPRTALPLQCSRCGTSVQRRSIGSRRMFPAMGTPGAPAHRISRRRRGRRSRMLHSGRSRSSHRRRPCSHRRTLRRGSPASRHPRRIRADRHCYSRLPRSCFRHHTVPWHRWRHRRRQRGMRRNHRSRRCTVRPPNTRHRRSPPGTLRNPGSTSCNFPSPRTCRRRRVGGTSRSPTGNSSRFRRTRIRKCRYCRTCRRRSSHSTSFPRRRLAPCSNSALHTRSSPCCIPGVRLGR